MTEDRNQNREEIRQRINENEVDITEGWTFRQFSRRCLWLQRLMISQMVKSFGTYQPVTLAARQLKPGDRDCADRWSMIEGAIRLDNVSNVLDLGCAEGYFVREAASRMKCIALGVDADVRRVTVAQNIVSYEGLAGASFLLGFITPEFVRKLPVFDVVIFLSVLHHVMHERGMDEARDLMDAIRSRTNKKLVFDMGQSNEIDYVWASALPAMEPDPATWIVGFLRECGFSSVAIVGETDGYYQVHRRTLFVATP